MTWVQRTAAVHCCAFHAGDLSPLFIARDADSKTGISISFDLAKGLFSPLAWEKGRGISQGLYALTGELCSQVRAPGST